MPTIVEIKNKILNNTLDNSFLIFECEDDFFIAKQYIEEICFKNNYTKNKIYSINDPEKLGQDIFNIDDINYLNILEVEEFSERSDDYSKFSNTIVLCHKIDKNLQTILKDYVVKVKKPEEWQTIAYIKQICPGLADDKFDSLISFFYRVTRGDIYRINNELSKIMVFPKELQGNILYQLLVAPESDLYDINKFEVADLFLKMTVVPDKVLNEVLAFKIHSDQLDIDPISIVSTLITKIKNLMYISYGSGITNFESVGISEKYKWALNKFPKITSDIARDKLKFLTLIDLKLKSSELDLASNKLLDYILVNMFQNN